MERITYPETRRDTTEGSIGELTFADPYQWLEQDEDEEVLTWQKVQTDLAEQYLRTWPGFTPLYDAVGAATVDTRLAVPRRAGGRWFAAVVPSPGAEQPVLRVSDEPLGPGRVLVDPNALTEDAGVPVSLDWYYPSPDGAHVAYGLSFGGDEQSVLHVVQTATGDVLADRIPHMTLGAVAWLPDGTSFYCNAGVPGQGLSRSILRHRLGQTTLSEPEPVDLTGYALPSVQVSHDGRYAAILLGHYRFRPAYVRDLAGDGAWRPFLLDYDGHCLGDFVGDRYVAVTTEDAPRGRVVAIPVSSPGDHDSWQELVAEGESVIRNVGFAGDHLLTHELLDGLPRIRVFTLDGAPEGEVALPGTGAVSLDARYPAALPATPLAYSSQSSADVVYAYSAIDVAPAVYRYDIEARSLEALTDPGAAIAGIVTRQVFATSPDGTRIPVTLAHREGLDLAVPQPTLLSAYGGFNVVFFSGYYPYLVPFLRAGGVYAFAHTRGGGEYGEPWWEAGRLAFKQNVFDDFAAVAEHLIAAGLTTTDRLAIMGGSNGGLLTAVAANQRPDLYGAVVSLIGVYDLLRGVRDPVTGYVITNEFGDPYDATQGKWLAAYSPCQNVRVGERYPATFIGAGERDMRCPPWHARKFAAALQYGQAGEGPVLLAVQPEAGHGPGKPSSVQIANTTAWLAFVMRWLGMDLEGVQK